MYVPRNASWAAAHVGAAGAALGWRAEGGLVEGVEIGNEPDLFVLNGYRPWGWGYAAYASDFALHAAALRAAGLPPARVQGAVYSSGTGGGDFAAALVNYSAEFARGGVLGAVSVHYYPLTACLGPEFVSVAALLADAAASGVAALAPAAAAAASAGIPFRIGEGNSVSCGGVTGVSDVFAAALWALDAMLNAAAAGVSAWNWHGGPHDVYAPIAFLNGSRAPTVRPLFYALWAMAGAAANGGVIMAANVSSSNAAIKAWALRDATGAWRIVLIHKGASGADAGAGGAAAAAASVTVTPRTPCVAPGNLVRLTAGGNVTATDGVRFGGRTFDGSADGTPRGAPVSEAVPCAAAAGTWSFLIDPTSIAILTVAA
jgi:hypothetical protein